MGVEGLVLALGVVIAKPVGWALVAISLLALAIEGVRAYRRRGQSETPDRWQCLQAQLVKLDGVRTWLALQEDQERSMPLEEDRVFQWAKETYELIGDDFPEAADQFMGGDLVTLGSPYFALAYSEQRNEQGRSDYLEGRAAMVKAIIKARHSDTAQQLASGHVEALGDPGEGRDP